ncbi:hypothetical protein NL676_015858 [Syzygium grande]|nr:hypothetical protein NL676_015858 [Syzygium grande]
MSFGTFKISKGFRRWLKLNYRDLGRVTQSTYTSDVRIRYHWTRTELRPLKQPSREATGDVHIHRVKARSCSAPPPTLFEARDLQALAGRHIPAIAVEKLLLGISCARGNRFNPPIDRPRRVKPLDRLIEFGSDGFGYGKQNSRNPYERSSGVTARPNSRFLTATVLGVQQANKAVEVNEMWRLRQKEVELDNRIKGRSRDESSNRRESSSRRHHKDATSSRSTSNSHDIDDYSAEPSCSQSRSAHDRRHKRGDEGFGDEDIEEFLHSRVKRGRGAIGSRMDETGPYLSSCPGSKELSPSPELREARVTYGPEKPYSLMASGSPKEDGHKDRHKKAKKVHLSSSRKHSSKHRSEATVAIKADQVTTLGIGPDMEFEAQIEPEWLGGVSETRGNRPCLSSSSRNERRPFKQLGSLKIWLHDAEEDRRWRKLE